jgi:hypothetical protein
VPAGATCAVAFDVVTETSGTSINTVEVTSNLGAASPAVAALEVAAPSVLEIPTSSTLGLAFLALLLALGGLWRLRS